MRRMKQSMFICVVCTCVNDSVDAWTLERPQEKVKVAVRENDGGSNKRDVDTKVEMQGGHGGTALIPPLRRQKKLVSLHEFQASRAT